MKLKIAIIDICGTLFESNTTFDFLDYFIRSWKFRLFRKISKSIIWRVFNKICRRLGGWDLTRIIALRFLKGYSRQQLTVAAEDFYNTYLVHKIQQPVYVVVEELRRTGYKLCLVSATLDCIAEVVARKWRIESYYSSSLRYDNSFCEGCLRTDYLGKKIEYLRRIGIYPPFDVTLTDDFSDMGLLRNSHKCIVVSKRSKTESWIENLKRAGIDNYELIILS